MKRLGLIMILMIGAGVLAGQGVQDSLLRSGRAAYQSGDYAKAIACYRGYLHYAEQQHDNHATADALRLIGDAFRASREWQEALHQLAIGLEIATQGGDEAMVGRIQNRIAAVKFEMSDLTGAQAAAQIALDRSIQAHDEATRANTLNILGAIFRQSGEYAKALPAFSQSIAILRSLGDTTDIPNALNNMSSTMIFLHDYQAAIDTALHSYAMADAMDILVYKQVAAQMLYQAYRDHGDWEASLKWMEEFMNLTGEMNSQAHVKEVETLRLEMESVRREEENARLKAENALQEETIANQNGRAIAVGSTAAFAVLFTIGLAVVVRRQRKQVAQLRSQNFKIEAQSSEIQAYNDRLKEIATEREAQQKRLLELHEIKDKLFSIISHDLRSPLNSIQGILNLFENQLIDSNQFANMANMLKTRVDGTTLLLDNLLNWSRTQVDGFVAEPTFLDLAEIAEQECRLQSPAAQAKQIQLENCIPKATNAMGDKTMVELVIRNLVSNAIKFTEPGGQVQLIAASERAQCQVGIQDNGIGVSEQQVGKLMGRDYYSTQGTAKEKGSGIGLRLCREFIALNHGQFWLSHNLGKGTTFWFTLPMAT